LIEVLIAGLILSSLVGSAALVINQAVHVLEQLDAATAMARALPTLQIRIQSELEKQHHSGNGKFGPYISYDWRASVARRGQFQSLALDEHTGKRQKQGFEITLNRIHLKLKYHRDKREKLREYDFQELSWRQR